MPDLIQKEYHLERTDKKYNNDGEPTLVTIRQATQKETILRDKFLLEMKNQYSAFIKDGIETFTHLGYYKNWLLGHKYVDDKWNRLQWIEKFILRTIQTIQNNDIYLTLAAFNIVDEKGRPALMFKQGYLDETKSHSLNSVVSNDVLEEVYEKVLEMNPTWAGESDRVIDFLVKEYHLEQYTSNFKDLVLKSMFSKSKSYLISLMEEINQDVFENNGVIKVDISIKTLDNGGQIFLYLKQLTDPPENIILYYEPNLSAKSGQSRSFIGIVEHGKFEIRIIASRDKLTYWDVNVDRIIIGLRDAIRWWKTDALYTKKDYKDMAEAAEAAEAYGENDDDQYPDWKGDSIGPGGKWVNYDDDD